MRKDDIRMTKTEMEQFRVALEASVKELDGSALRRDGIVIEFAAEDLERIHLAGAREIAVRRLEDAAGKLREARAALRRIDAGSYGVCLECEGEISPRRLAALPWATLCIGCQQESDGRSRRQELPDYPMAA
jgi:DnaK suppressor protein